MLAVAVVAGAEWPRIARALGAEQRSGRGDGGRRSRRPGGLARPGHLRIVKDVEDVMRPAKPSTTDTDDFVESVRRDLVRLPTFDRDA